ncbi:hypothetical protein OESDEN_12398 [Oesophagostomum dentatum]|uniref:Alkyl hydroperoxide reductase subunit C/ Thiol specific antioxidant domain-containing protein n=1 Tax=Oesophagostomum dentatum TaxID=61180 RepID=A0A0B1SR76_OESDE|nr:hypothetical protein OESDEN_12398 [Oesophagostomum dentatum]
MIALSCDSAESHRKWIDDIVAYANSPNVTSKISYFLYLSLLIQIISKFFSFQGDGFPFEIIADEERKLAVQLEMLDPAEKDSKGMPLTARAVFIIDPKKMLRAQILYPATTGRNFEYVNN